ncbi:unnamed protein product [Dovyalis caffra]|uniref:Subtilisin-like protease n=1 Tax=Dovyalis caffra TaxID=77055 RepID=A0AAV1RTY4_9ROSI|nr:unnamed protein product [Dovyalis caffra]
MHATVGSSIPPPASNLNQLISRVTSLGLLTREALSSLFSLSLSFLVPKILDLQGAQTANGAEIWACEEGCLDSDLVKGKIVLCNRFEGVAEAYKAGALGAVVLNTLIDVSVVVPLPASAIAGLDFILVEDYVKTTKNPRVQLFRSEVVKDFTAPTVASFSACGPLLLAPEIMKPDVTAPGVEILAAYSPIASPSNGPLYKRQAKYSIVSGTSMSSPHVAGVASYVKSFHPDWSPSAIKSAIMTTAWPMNTSTNKAGEISYGSGHINPVKAIDPGLVYDAHKEDYITLLCGLGFDSNAVQVISGDNSTCPNAKTFPFSFNYPAMTVLTSPMTSFLYKFHRTVTNVGFSNSTYRAKIIPSPNITVQVQPTILSFKSLHEKKSFVVTVNGAGLPDMSFKASASAWLLWSDGTHSVRSPVFVLPVNTED